MSDALERAPLVGISRSFVRAVQLAERFGPTRLPILLIGATGTGKDLLARHIHQCSKRRGQFVPVNCGAIPREMAESLLFGHRRGAFSGAVESRRGHLERSAGGTLFLDEVSSLPLDSQPKLLRALDTGEIQPLGEESPRFVDMRIVAAVQDALPSDLARGAFRYDLYQRLAGVVIMIASLSERPDDVLPLAQYFAALEGRALEPEVEGVLLHHSWPGNVRELRHVIERAGQLVSNGTLSAAAVGEAIALGAAGTVRRDGEPSRRSALRAEFLTVGPAVAWDFTRLMAVLGIKRSALYERLRAAGVSLRTVRKSGESAGRPVERSDDAARGGGSQSASH